MESQGKVYLNISVPLIEKIFGKAFYLIKDVFISDLALMILFQSQTRRLLLSNNFFSYADFRQQACIGSTSSIKKFFPETSIYSMARVVIMASDAVLKTVAFIGGNYLSLFLSDDDAKASIRLKDKIKHSKLTKLLVQNIKKKEGRCLTGSKAPRN